jgi:hypothetical protein
MAGQQSLDAAHALRAVAVVALISVVFPIYFTRGRHLVWIVFFVVGGVLLAVAEKI